MNHFLPHPALAHTRTRCRSGPILTGTWVIRKLSTDGAKASVEPLFDNGPTRKRRPRVTPVPGQSTARIITRNTHRIRTTGNCSGARQGPETASTETREHETEGDKTPPRTLQRQQKRRDMRLVSRRSHRQFPVSTRNGKKSENLG